MMKMIDAMPCLLGAILATGACPGSAAQSGMSGASRIEVSNRDNTGTSPSPEKRHGAQTLIFPGSDGRQNREAEGMGFEPTIPFGTPDFKSSPKCRERRGIR